MSKIIAKITKDGVTHQFKRCVTDGHVIYEARKNGKMQLLYIMGCEESALILEMARLLEEKKAL